MTHINVATAEDIQALRRDITHIASLLERMTSKPRVLSVQQYAEEAGLSESTVRRMCVNGEINATRHGKLWRITV